MLKNILIGLAFFFLLSSLIKNALEYNHNKQFYATYKKDYENEKKKNNQLKMQIIKSSDPQEVEKTIRNRLNMIKENEIAIIVPTPTPVPTLVTPPPLPVYQQWVNVFAK